MKTLSSSTHYAFTFVFLFFSQLAVGQFKIDGRIMDGKEGIPFANAALFNSSDSSLVTGSASDFDGQFVLRATTGNYYLVLSYIGYKPHNIDNIVLTKSISLGEISLQSDAQKMEELVFESEKAAVEVKPGVKKYNYADAPNMESSSAAEVLKNIPSIGTDSEDEITMRGRNVTILIDGVETDVVNILDQIPANEIESIEVISNPSAKYDTKNGESIINVILKNNNKSGANLYSNIRVGNDNFINPILGGGIVKNKWDVNANTSLKWNERIDEGLSKRIGLTNDSSRTNQYYNGTSEEFNQYYRLKVKYNISDKSSIETNLSGGKRDTEKGKHYDIGYSDKDLSPTHYSVRNRNGNDQRSWFRGYLNYKKEFENKHNITSRFVFKSNQKDESFIFIDSTFNADKSFDEVERIDKIDDQITQNNQYIFRVDYEMPLRNNYQLDLGWQSRMRSIDQNYLYSSFELDAGWVLDADRSNRYIYDEAIHSLYGELSGTLGGFNKFGYNIGLKGIVSTLDPKPVGFQGDYKNTIWFLSPSVQTSYQLTDTQLITFNYSRKNKLPSYYRLNPFITYYGPASISYGNPYLLPEIINMMELTHDMTWLDDKLYLSNSVYYKKVEDASIRYSFEDLDEVVNFTYTNVDGASSLGWEFIANYQIIDDLKFNASFNLFNSDFKNLNNSQEIVERNGTNFNSKGSLEYQNEIGLSTQFTINYYSKSLNSQGYTEPYYFADWVIKQNLVDDKISLSLKVSDLFNSWTRNSVVDFSDTIAAENSYTRNTFRYYMTLSYRFSSFKVG